MTRVVKLGGRAQKECAPWIAKAWAVEPGALCIVHGGGDEVSAYQKRSGTEPSFVGGRRITSEDDIAVLRMVLSGLVNKRLVSELVIAGAPAIGISGEDASLITATLSAGGRLGRVGNPTGINERLLSSLMAAGFLPVISPLSRDASGKGALNVNGDDAAAALAVALEADELLLVVDVDGVLDEEGKTIPAMDTDIARSLVERGSASGGMSAKLEAAHAALVGGVARVRVCSLAGLSDSTSGTQITLTPSLV